MQARRPHFKDESGALVSPPEVRLDRELVPVLWIFLPAILCFLLQGRTLGRTIEGGNLGLRLGCAGLLIGLVAGFWRLGVLSRAMQELSPCWKSGPLWNRYRSSRAALVVAYVVVLVIFVVSVGGLANRLISFGKPKVERAVVVGMSGTGSKGGYFLVRLSTEERGFQEKLPVSSGEFRDLRILDLVEVHTRCGVLGYDYVTDIVKVGSQRVSQ